MGVVLNIRIIGLINSKFKFEDIILMFDAVDLTRYEGKTGLLLVQYLLIMIYYLIYNY